MSALLIHRSVVPRLRTTRPLADMKRAIIIEFDDSNVHRCALIHIGVDLFVCLNVWFFLFYYDYFVIVVCFVVVV